MRDKQTYSVTDINNMASSPKLKDAPAKLKSKVWEYYGFRECSDNRATCKMCFTDVSYPKAGSTTNLHQHLKRKHSLDVFESKSVNMKFCLLQFVLDKTLSSFHLSQWLNTLWILNNYLIVAISYKWIESKIIESPYKNRNRIESSFQWIVAALITTK